MIFINNGKLIIPRGISPSFSKYGDSKLELKKITYTENGTYKISPGDNFDGILDVDVSVNVKYKSPDGLKFAYSTDFDYSNIEFEPRTGFNFDNMFTHSELTSFPMIDTSKCTSMTETFMNTSAASIPKYDISGMNDFDKAFESSSIETLPWDKIHINCIDGEAYCTHMFYQCGALTHVPLITYDIEGLTGGLDFSEMFYNCRNITLDPNQEFILCDEDRNYEYQLSLAYMFYGCNNLTKMPKFTGTTGVNDTSDMFSNCINLTDASNLNTFDFYCVENASNMFYGCKNLTGDLTIQSSGSSSLTNMSHMFYYCNNITGVFIRQPFDGTPTDMSYMFYNCKNMINFDADNYIKAETPTNTSNMFSGCNKLESIFMLDNNGQLGYDIVLNTNNAERMFYNCESFISNNGIYFISDNCTTFKEAFYFCRNIKSVTLTSMKSCTDVNNMFYYCTSLTTFGLENGGAIYTNCSSLSNMFSSCNSLTSVPDIYLTDEKVDLGDNNPIVNIFVGSARALKSVGTIHIGENMTYSPGKYPLQTTPFNPVENNQNYFPLLTDFGGFENYEGHLNLRGLKSLSHESALNIINKLKNSSHPETEYKVVFSDHLRNLLTEAEIKIAQDKGYRIYFLS